MPCYALPCHAVPCHAVPLSLSLSPAALIYGTSCITVAALASLLGGGVLQVSLAAPAPIRHGAEVTPLPPTPARRLCPAERDPATRRWLPESP